MVSMQSFEHFDIVSLVNESTERTKLLLLICFLSIEVSLENHTKKEKNKLRHHNVIFMVCTLIDRSFYPMSLQEIAQLNCEKTFYTVHVSVQQVFSVVQNVCLVHHVHSGYPFPLQFFLLSFPMNSCFRELKRKGSFEGCLPTVIEPWFP